MSDFNWTAEYSVGNQAIDADHQELFSLINALETASMTDGFLSDILGKLEHYAKGHFAREEALMRRIEFPGYEEHVVEHRNFVEWLKTVKATYNRAAESPFQIGDLVNHFLRHWLVNHIIKEDMKYRDFMMEKGSRSHGLQ